MILFFKLLLAHLIGDFFLQSKASIRQKNTLKWRAPHLYFHVVIHFVLVLLLAGIEMWRQAAIIAGMHYIIDGCKLQFQNKKNKQVLFFVDQLLHLLVLISVVYFTLKTPMPEFSEQTLILLTFIIFLTRPASFIVAQAMSHWNEKITLDEETNQSLPNAGQYIGIIERLLIFIFILIGQWGAIGFLMAAKSIFRFGDLTRTKDRRLTEYILIGTFLSFGTAILTGILYQHFF